MKAKKQSEIVEKYWEGKSRQAEEQALLNSDLSGVATDEKAYFESIKQFSELSLGSDFEAAILEKISADEPKIRQLNPSWLLKIAAVFALGLSFYFMYQPIPVLEESNEIAAIEDPEEAFEVTKQALLLISEKLNKASAVDVGLDKFEDARNKIKQGS